MRYSREGNHVFDHKQGSLLCKGGGEGTPICKKCSLLFARRWLKTDDPLPEEFVPVIVEAAIHATGKTLEGIIDRVFQWPEFFEIAFKAKGDPVRWHIAVSHRIRNFGPWPEDFDHRAMELMGDDVLTFVALSGIPSFMDRVLQKIGTEKINDLVRRAEDDNNSSVLVMLGIIDRKPDSSTLDLLETVTDPRNPGRFKKPRFLVLASHALRKWRHRDPRKRR